MSDQLSLAPPKTPKIWAGDIGECDICKQGIKGDFFDARTYNGLWATMCLPCWRIHSPGQLGVGQGQHYKQRTDGKWVKVAG